MVLTPFQKAKLIEKMKVLARNPIELYRGRHLCELCVAPAGLEKAVLPNGVIDPNSPWTKWAAQRWSNGEIRVTGGQVIFAAPVLIVHYIEDHGYLPPAEFLRAVDNELY